jgi:hypothetical protein
VFVHDFVAIPRPVDGALAGLTDVLAGDLGRLVAEAWAADTAVWTAAGLDVADLEPSRPIPLTVDGPRSRDAGAVVHLSWTSEGARLVPSVDCDLELIARGPALSDLQIMGRYRFGDLPPRSAAETSIAHRATVTAIRRLLDALSTEIQQRDRPDGAGAGRGAGRPTMRN